MKHAGATPLPSGLSTPRTTERSSDPARLCQNAVLVGRKYIAAPIVVRMTQGWCGARASSYARVAQSFSSRASSSSSLISTPRKSRNHIRRRRDRAPDTYLLLFCRSTPFLHSMSTTYCSVNRGRASLPAAAAAAAAPASPSLCGGATPAAPAASSSSFRLQGRRAGGRSVARCRLLLRRSMRAGVSQRQNTPPPRGARTAAS